MTILMLLGGLVLLIAGGEAWVRGASKLAVSRGISPLAVQPAPLDFDVLAMPAVATLGLAMKTVVLPLTLITLLVVTLRAWRARQTA
jgi:hypothetical protein